MRRRRSDLALRRGYWPVAMSRYLPEAECHGVEMLKPGLRTSKEPCTSWRACVTPPIRQTHPKNKAAVPQYACTVRDSLQSGSHDLFESGADSHKSLFAYKTRDLVYVSLIRMVLGRVRSELSRRKHEYSGRTFVVNNRFQLEIWKIAPLRVV